MLFQFQIISFFACRSQSHPRTRMLVSRRNALFRMKFVVRYSKNADLLHVIVQARCQKRVGHRRVPCARRPGINVLFETVG